MESSWMWKIEGLWVHLELGHNELIMLHHVVHVLGHLLELDFQSENVLVLGNRSPLSVLRVTSCIPWLGSSHVISERERRNKEHTNSIPQTMPTDEVEICLGKTCKHWEEWLRGLLGWAILPIPKSIKDLGKLFFLEGKKLWISACFEWMSEVFIIPFKPYSLSLIEGHASLVHLCPMSSFDWVAYSEFMGVSHWFW